LDCLLQFDITSQILAYLGKSQIEKIEALRPPNQYIYDYAVSKAIKNLQHALEKLLGQQLENGGKILTPKEFLELVNQEVAKIGINH